MGTAAERDARRSAIESNFNKQRADAEKGYITNKETLEKDYRGGLAEIEQEKREAFLAEGLNSDGSDPQGRPQG